MTRATPEPIRPGQLAERAVAGAVGLRGGGPAPAASAPAAGFRYASGPLLSDPGSSLVPANTLARGVASGDVWVAPWHAREGFWGGTEALDRLFAVGGLARAGRDG